VTKSKIMLFDIHVCIYNSLMNDAHIISEVVYQ